MVEYIERLTGIKDIEGNTLEQIISDPNILKNISKIQREKLQMIREIIQNSYFSKSKDQIKCSKDSYEHFKFLKLEDVEYFYVLLLRKNNSVIKRVQISKGGTAGTVVDTKLIAQETVINKANSIILAHNHPSGNTKPSEADRKITTKIKEGLKFLDVEVLDHIIIAGEDYYSFADNCDLN